MAEDDYEEAVPGAVAAASAPTYVPSSKTLRQQLRAVKAQEKLTTATLKHQKVIAKATTAQTKAQMKLDKATTDKETATVKRDLRRVKFERGVQKALDKKIKEDEKEELERQSLRKSWLTGRIVPIKASRRARAHYGRRWKKTEPNVPRGAR
jgi:hypothetical protein